MTDQHPITPPPELVQQWVDMLSSRSDQAVFTMAAQWGANQELEACCKWIPIATPWDEEQLRAARRPKPPSLKEEARQIIDCLIEGDCLNDDDAVTLLRVLEAFND